MPKSFSKPIPMEIKDKIYVRSNIEELTDSEGITYYTYDEEVYTNEQYIIKQNDKLNELQSTVTDLLMTSPFGEGVE